MTSQSTNSGPIDVAALLSSSQEVSTQIGKAITDLVMLREDQIISNEREAAAIREQAAAEAGGIRLEAADKLKMQAANAEAAAWFGVNKDAANFVLAGLGTEIMNGVQDLRQRREEIIARQSTGFLDDPLSWIINQVVVPFKEEALETRAAGVAQDMDVARGIIARATEMAGLNSAIVASSAEERANLAAKAIEARAAKEVEQSNQRMAALGMQELNVRVALNRSQFDMLNATNNAIINLEQLELSRRANVRAENADRRAEAGEERADTYLGIAVANNIRDAERLDMQRKSQDLSRQLTELEIEAKGLSAEAKATLQSALNRSAAVIGAQPPTVDQYNRMDQRARASWQRLMSDPNVMENGQLGYNAGEAIEEVAENNWPLTPSMKFVYNKMDEVRARVIERFSQPGSPIQWKAMTKDARSNAINMEIRRQLERERANVPDQGSIYSPPPVASVLTIPAVAATSIAKDLTPFAADPNNPLRANVVVASALMKIQKNEATVEQMANEISTIYKSVMMDNNTQRQYKRFAIAGLSEATTGFRTSISGPAFIGGNAAYGTRSTVIDLSNEAAVTSFLMRSQVQTLKNNQSKEQQMILPQRGQ